MQTLRFAACVLLPLLLGACANDGVHFPRPELYAGRATLWAEAVDVELIVQNASEAPMWLRRLDLTLSAAGQPIAAGVWEGDRQIDPASSVLLGVNLPLVEGASPPPGDAPGDLLVGARYARSGVIGVLGGEGHEYRVPIVVRRGREEE